MIRRKDDYYGINDRRTVHRKHESLQIVVILGCWIYISLVTVASELKSYSKGGKKANSKFVSEFNGMSTLEH